MTTEAVHVLNGAKATRARLFILALVTVGTMINYLDRTVISVARAVAHEGARPQRGVMGVAFSAFSWTYAAAQIPGGILLDRFGVRLTYFCSVTLWSLCTLLQGLATGLGSLVGARLALGIAEAPAFPSNSRILSTWFPQAGARSRHWRLLGRTVLRARIPQPRAVLDQRDVRMAGAVHHRGAGGCVVRFHRGGSLYRDPHESKRVNQAELAHIAAGGGLGDHGSTTRFEWRHIRLPAAPAPDPRRFDRPVRRQFDARVLPHLVSDLPRDRAPDGLAQGWILRDPAVHCGIGRRGRRRRSLRTFCCARPAPRTSRASSRSSPAWCSPLPSSRRISSTATCS